MCPCSAFERLTALKEELVEPLNEVYDEKVVKEWMNDKVDDNIRYAKKRIKELSDLEKTLE